MKAIKPFAILMLLLIFSALYMLNGGKKGKCDVYESDSELSRNIEHVYRLNDRRIDKYGVAEHDIPLTYYGYIDNKFIGYQIAMHNVALKSREYFYDYFETKNKSYLNKALFLVNFMISSAKPRKNNILLLENNFYWPPYDLSPPWSGAIVQAGFIKSLMLAYKATGDEAYLKIAEFALNAFEHGIDECGIVYLREGRKKEKYYWYPEYAGNSPPFVLNGFITSLIWIKEYYDETKSEKAKRIYERGLKSLIHFLPEYSTEDNWSYYDAEKRRANLHYHKLHIEQMKALYNMTGEKIFLSYAEKWEKAMKK